MRNSNIGDNQQLSNWTEDTHSKNKFMTSTESLAIFPLLNEVMDIIEVSLQPLCWNIINSLLDHFVSFMTFILTDTRRQPIVIFIRVSLTASHAKHYFYLPVDHCVSFSEVPV